MKCPWFAFKNDGDDLWTIGNGEESWCRMLEHKADADSVVDTLNERDASRAVAKALYEALKATKNHQRRVLRQTIAKLSGPVCEDCDLDHLLDLLIAADETMGDSIDAAMAVIEEKL